MNNDDDGQNQSLADIDQDLHTIFSHHPHSHLNDAGDPVIPADALVDVFQSFADIYNGIQLLSGDEMDMLKTLLASNPGLEVTPQILLDFIAEKAKVSANASLPRSPPSQDRQETERTIEYPSSDESIGSILLPTRTPSRPPSRGPGGSTKNSPFDTEARQRSQPLGIAPPSSWNNKRPIPAGRRKSIDAGSRSDSDVRVFHSLCSCHAMQRLISGTFSPPLWCIYSLSRPAVLLQDNNPAEHRIQHHQTLPNLLFHPVVFLIH